MPRSRLIHPLSIAIGGLLIIALVILASLPLIIQYTAINWLQEQGIERAEIDNIDLNLFTGEAAIDKLRLTPENQPTMVIGRLMVDVGMTELINRRFVIEKLLLSNSSLQISQSEDGLIIGGIRLPAAETQPTSEPTQNQPWSFGISRLDLYDTHIAYRAVEVDARIDIYHAAISDVYSWLESSSSPVKIDLVVNQAPLAIDARVQAFSKKPRLDLKLSLQQFSLANVAPLLRKQGIRLDGLIDVEQDISLTIIDPESLDLGLEGSILLSRMDLTANDARVQSPQLEWTGRVGLARRQERQEITVDGQLIANELSADYAHYVSHSGMLGIDTLVQYFDEPQGQPRLSGNATLTARNFSAWDAGKKIQLATFAALNVDGVKIRQVDAYDIDTITVHDLQALAPGSDMKVSSQPSLLNIGKVQMSGLHIPSPQRFEGRQLIITDFDGRLIKSKTGRLEYLDTAEETPDTQQPGKESSPATTPGPSLQLAEFRLAGNNQFQFTDYSVSPSFVSRLHDIELEIKNINTAEPGSDMQLRLNSQVGDYGSLKLAGTLRPFGERFSSDLQGSLRSIELPPLSSYTGKHLGYVLKRGQMDAELVLRIDQDELNIGSELNLRKLNLAARDSAEGREFTDQLAMPLDKTLDLLRDKQDNIKLKLPVTGRLDDPQFELSQIINKASASALKLAAVQYLKMTLQPWGTLLTVAKLAGKAAQQGFDPIEFMPGDSRLPEQQRPYLDKLAALLLNRPELSLTLCGLATDQDTRQLEQLDKYKKHKPLAEDQLLDALKSLAKKRAITVKDNLMQRHAIESERLFVCHPEIKQEDLTPRVEISL